jgi:hypothetical protein
MTFPHHCRGHHYDPWPRRASHGPTLTGMHRSPARSAHRTGTAELLGDLRRFDASLEGRANSVQLARRQMNDGRLGPRLVRGPELTRRLPTASLLLGNRGRQQSVELLIVKMLDGGRQVFRQNMPPRRRRRCVRGRQLVVLPLNRPIGATTGELVWPRVLQRAVPPLRGQPSSPPSL